MQQVSLSVGGGGVPNDQIRRPASPVLGLQQQSPVNTTTTASDIEKDIFVVRPGSSAPCSSAKVSGRVFEISTDRPRPFARARVLYVCGIPSGVGRLGVGDCNDATFQVPITVNDDTIVDVDLTHFRVSCPGIPLP